MRKKRAERINGKVYIACILFKIKNNERLLTSHEKFDPCLKLREKGNHHNSNSDRIE